MRSMQSASQFPVPPGSPESSSAGESRHSDKPASIAVADIPSAQIVAANPAWRKLLLQAEMVAPYLQLAAIEGEHGAGKQTLARYLYSRSPWPLRLSAPRRPRMAGHRRRPRHPRRLHLSRSRRPARPSRPGSSPRRAQSPPGPPAGPRRAARLFADLASPDGRPGPLAARPRLPPHRRPLRHSAPAPAPRRHRRPSPRPCSIASARATSSRPFRSAPAAIARLLQHNWPGNVRELASVLETALLEVVNGVIRADDLALLSAPRAPPHPSRRPIRKPRPRRRHPASRPICARPEPRQQAPRRPPARHQPLHPLPHPRHPPAPARLTPCSLLPVHCPLFTVHCPLSPTPYSLFPAFSSTLDTTAFSRRPHPKDPPR